MYLKILNSLTNSIIEYIEFDLDEDELDFLSTKEFYDILFDHDNFDIVYNNEKILIKDNIYIKNILNFDNIVNTIYVLPSLKTSLYYDYINDNIDVNIDNNTFYLINKHQEINIKSKFIQQIENRKKRKDYINFKKKINKNFDLEENVITKNKINDILKLIKKK